MIGTRPDSPTSASLPAAARLPINRCNLPAAILGSLTFQRHPTALHIDGVAELHRDLFERLGKLLNPEVRARHFMDYMTMHFRLESLEDAGLTPSTGRARPNADYLRVLRGWMFDSESREGAVLKGWVESRFGLLTRYHAGALSYSGTDADLRYLQARASGVYNTNAIEAQLDVLYAYCQYELSQQKPGVEHLRLYRGVNDLPEHDWLCRTARHSGVVLLNNLNSFSSDPERADEFGDRILRAEVPLAKILCFSGLAPGILNGEKEYMVIGGIYQVELVDPPL